MGKKKFIDKKRAATFHLLARDTSAESGHNQGPESDHVFVRVDANPLSIKGFEEDDHDDNADSVGPSEDPNSNFADAPGGENSMMIPSWLRSYESKPLPDNVRKEILELGFPDDGYNYLLHLREIKNAGGGAAYYENPKANLEQLPLDVKAYDASRVQIKEEVVEAIEDKLLYSVSEKTVNVRVQRAIDPEVVALLDDNDSQLGSDIEDLEEDFVTQANLPEEGESSGFDGHHGRIEKLQVAVVNDVSSSDLNDNFEDARDHPVDENAETVAEKPRVRRHIDEQFDLLKLQEYDTESENSYDYCDFEDEGGQPLAEKLNNALQNRNIDDLEPDDHYKAPADFLRGGENATNEQLVNSAAHILRRCAEYAEKLANSDEDDQEIVIVEESSDESKRWDCASIVSTYSNLDNHPGKIGAPESHRKKRLAETISGALKGTNKDIIHLGGKAMIPVDYLPRGRKTSKEKVKLEDKVEQPKKKVGQESKEEKKERKAAVKAEKREARHVKKEIKELYSFETKQAQKAVAITGPSCIRLM